MNAKRVCAKLTLAFVATVCCLSFSGCDGDYAVPITSTPTRKIDQRLLGNWLSKDGSDKIKVRKLDDSIYIVSFNGDLYRAFHSDLGGTAFISAQEIDSSDRKYAYLAYKLSDDGKRLSVRAVNTKLIPKETNSSVRVQKLLKINLQSAELFDDEAQFDRDK
ncbi:MAG TPA: hypothetical protein VGJ55_08725 [Pyrinomonadaceae bacterium]|jgi:hypothetical protein